MASLKVNVLSRKLIKPSNETPHHLQSLKLSLFEQLAPTFYVDAIFYFLGGRDDGDRALSARRIVQLEESLSETLTFFYPLAGRFVQNDVSIDCGDQGVEFFQAQVIGKLVDFLQERPQVELLNKFLPWDFPPTTILVTSPLLAIQINSFDCGGLVIGIRISHIIADGSTMVTFINEWAATSKTGIGQMVCPRSGYDDFASLFPARSMLSGAKFRIVSTPKPQHPRNNDAKIVTGRLLFDENVISHVRCNVASSVHFKPTRVAVAIAVIWKALIGVDFAKHGQLRDSVLCLAMNLRDKLASQASDPSCGNFWMPIAVPFLANKAKMEVYDLMVILQDTIKCAKAKLTKASSDDISTILMNSRREIVEKRNQIDKADVYICSSWCRFPLYEADFGWGKPFWVSSATQLFEMIWLMDTSDGAGIEAWISLKEKDMNEFKLDPNISSLVSNQQYSLF